jgi:hypothetical protein
MLTELSWLPFNFHKKIVICTQRVTLHLVFHASESENVTQIKYEDLCHICEHTLNTSIGRKEMEG